MCFRGTTDLFSEGATQSDNWLSALYRKEMFYPDLGRMVAWPAPFVLVRVTEVDGVLPA